MSADVEATASEASVIRICAITDEISPSLEKSLAILREWGLGDVEIHTLWGTSMEVLDSQQVDRLGRLLQVQRLQLRVISSTIFLRCPLQGGPIPPAWDRRFQSLGGTYDQHLDWLTKCLAIADILKSPMVRIFGFWAEPGSSSATKEVIARLREATALAVDRGVTLALENCPHTFLDRTSRVLDVIEAVNSPRLRLLWDPSNAYKSGDREFAGLVERALPHLAHMHVKGIITGEALKKGRAYVPIDQGSVDYRFLFKKMIEAGYAGVVSLEPHYALPRSGREGAARQSFAALVRLADAARQDVGADTARRSPGHRT